MFDNEQTLDKTMGLEDTVTPAPAAPPTEPAPREYRTNSEKRFFEQQTASSLPITPTEQPPQTTVPDNTVVPPVAPPIDPVIPAVAATPTTDEPPAAEPTLAEDDFSVELPGTAAPEDGVLLDATVRHPDSPLTEDAPKWQHDAYNRLQADQSISAEDKKTISELPPTAWDKARRWQADTKTLGQFRDGNVPIAAVFDILTKQSKERTAEIEVESLNRLMSSPDKMVTFSEQHPQLFAGVLSELVNNHSEFVASTLQKAGFNVVKAEPFDKQKVLDKLKEHPMWDTFSETDIAEMVESQIEQLADMVGTQQQISPEDLAAELGNKQADTVATSDAYTKVVTTVKKVQDDEWIKAIGDGLQQSGIRPATQAEIAKNPAAAHLKTVLYNAALYGLDGVITNWDDHSSQWGASQPGFQSTFEELSSYLQRGDISRFTENAASMNPFYFEFGQKRAKTALIQNLYRTVENMLNGTSAPPDPPPPGIPPPTIDGTPPPAGERKYRTNSERRFFEARNQ